MRDKFNISKHFSDYITNIGPNPNLAKRIPKADIDPLSFMRKTLKKNPLFLSPVPETDINKIIRGLKDSATGHGDFSPLKLALNFIVDPLTHICNMPLTECVFPDTMKVANFIS